MHYIKTNYVSEEEFSSDINMYGRIQSGDITQKYEYNNKNVNRESDTNDNEEKLSENKGYESSIQGTTIDFNSIPTLNEDIEEDTYEDIGNTELSMLLEGSTTEATLGIDTEDTNNDDMLNEEEYEFFEDEDDYSDEDSSIEEEETYVSDEDDYDEYPTEEEEDYDEYSIEDDESDEDIYDAYDSYEGDASNEEDIEDEKDEEEDIEDEYSDEAYAEEDYAEYPEETNEGDYDKYEDEEISEVIEDYDEEYTDKESDEDYDEYEDEEDEDYGEYAEDTLKDEYYEEVSKIEDEVICNEHEEDKKEYSVIKDDNNDIENKVEEGYSIDTNSNICDEVPSSNIEDRDINLNKSSRENNSVEKCTNKVIHEADNNKNKEDEEIVDEDIPKNLVDFVRKFPKCDKSFALKYFSKKEIEENLLKGNINMYKNKLRL